MSADTDIRRWPAAAGTTLETVSCDSTDPAAVSVEQRALLARYVDAFERYDVASMRSPNS